MMIIRYAANAKVPFGGCLSVAPLSRGRERLDPERKLFREENSKNRTIIRKRILSLQSLVFSEI